MSSFREGTARKTRPGAKIPTAGCFSQHVSGVLGGMGFRDACSEGAGCRAGCRRGVVCL